MVSSSGQAARSAETNVREMGRRTRRRPGEERPGDKGNRVSASMVGRGTRRSCSSSRERLQRTLWRLSTGRARRGES